ncbi:hypothetical protein LCGC14_1530640, partial [marine sediment metagenome]
KVGLQLQGAWNILKEQLVLIGSAPFYNDNFGELTGKTIYGIIEHLLQITLTFETTNIYQFTLDALGDQDDGVINSLVLEPVKDPDFPLINQNAPNSYETFAELIARVLKYTGCYLRAEAGLAFKIIYPQSTDSVNETYYSSLSDGHVFYENTERQFLKRPNRVRTFSDQSVDKDWSVFTKGVALSDDWLLAGATFIGEYVPITEIIIDSKGTITSDALCDTWATFLLNKHSAETFGGRTVVPHDARPELYDRIQASDTRGS